MERTILQPGVEVPPGRVQRRLGELIAAEGANRCVSSSPVEMLWPTTAGAANRGARQRAGGPFGGRPSGALPGLASPQPVAPPPCMATMTVSSFSRGPSGVDNGLRSGKPRWKSSMESMCMIGSAIDRSSRLNRISGRRSHHSHYHSLRPSASSIAFSSPRALLSVSFHSFSGTLSATMPAPA